MVAGESDARCVEHRLEAHGGEEVDGHRRRAVGAEKLIDGNDGEFAGLELSARMGAENLLGDRSPFGALHIVDFPRTVQAGKADR